MSEFFRSVMGHAFYEHHVPALVSSLARIAVALELIAARLNPTPSKADA